MSLNVDDLPHFGDARYRLYHGRCNDAFPGATFKDGVTTDPVDARTARRLYQAFGPKLTIEPWEPSTPSHPEEGQRIGSKSAGAPALPKKRKRETRR